MFDTVSISAVLAPCYEMAALKRYWGAEMHAQEFTLRQPRAATYIGGSSQIPYRFTGGTG